MAQQFQQAQFQNNQQYFNQQQEVAHASPSASMLLQRGGATASLYGPSLSRTRPSDASAIAAAREAYDAQLSQMQASQEAAERSHASAQWESSQGVRGATAPFYNTAAGNALISQARLDLTNRSVSGLAGSSASHDNRQRAFHGECVLPVDIATGVPAEKNNAKFQQYPLQEYNRFDMRARTWAGPETQPRLKPAAYMPRRPLDVARRHDLVKSLKANQSISNYDHGLPFVAKHTNNLVSC